MRVTENRIRKIEESLHFGEKEPFGIFFKRDGYWNYDGKKFLDVKDFIKDAEKFFNHIIFIE